MTTLSTPLCNGSIRAAHAGLRMRARRELRVQRRPVRVPGDCARCESRRGSPAIVARVALRRLRPSPPLRGFLPLYRH